MDFYKNRATFTPAEAAALAAGAVPTDSLKAAIEGRAPCDTPEAVAAREVFKNIRWGCERAIYRFSTALAKATDSTGIAAAIEAVHSEAIPDYAFSFQLHALKFYLYPPYSYDEAIKRSRVFEREAIAALDNGFEKLHFEREHLATWLDWLELPCVYSFDPNKTTQQPQPQPAPPPVRPKPEESIKARNQRWLDHFVAQLSRNPEHGGKTRIYREIAHAEGVTAEVVRKGIEKAWKLTKPQPKKQATPFDVLGKR